MLNVLKALTSTKSGKQKELIVSTFKAIICPILEYANTICSSIISNSNIKKLQTIQNIALQIATSSSLLSSIEKVSTPGQTQTGLGMRVYPLLPQAAVLPGSDAGSVVKPASSFVIQNCQTSCSMWCLMYRACC